MGWRQFRPLLKWHYVLRGMALVTAGTGFLWKDTALIVAGLGAAAAPIRVEKSE